MTLSLPFGVQVCGGTASGKTSVCRAIIQNLASRRVALIAQDSFYRSLTAEQKTEAHAVSGNAAFNCAGGKRGPLVLPPALPAQARAHRHTLSPAPHVPAVTRNIVSSCRPCRPGSVRWRPRHQATRTETELAVTLFGGLGKLQL